MWKWAEYHYTSMNTDKLKQPLNANSTQNALAWANPTYWLQLPVPNNFPIFIPRFLVCLQLLRVQIRTKLTTQSGSSIVEQIESLNK
jgi:hypothetical protein